MLRYDDVELVVCVGCGTVKAVDKEAIDKGEIYFECVCEEDRGTSSFEHLVKKRRGWAVKSRSIIKRKRR